MNEEVEIKVELKNPTYVEAKLNEVAKFVRAKDQKDEYFTPKHKDFFSLNPIKEYFRIRCEDGKNELHYNYLHFDEENVLIKTDEYEVGVSNTEMMKIILDKVDMIQKVTVTKHRKTYDYGDFEICIDFVEELGYYIEVEAKKIIGSARETRDNCYNVLEKVGADWKEIPLEIRGYPIMVLAKREGRY